MFSRELPGEGFGDGFVSFFESSARSGDTAGVVRNHVLREESGNRQTCFTILGLALALTIFLLLRRPLSLLLILLRQLVCLPVVLLSPLVRGHLGSARSRLELWHGNLAKVDSEACWGSVTLHPFDGRGVVEVDAFGTFARILRCFVEDVLVEVLFF